MATKYRILIVGAGLGGLSAALALHADGHKVTVIDSAAEFTEAGAGIRIPPNSGRLLMRWGVDLDKLNKNLSGGYHFRRWEDGTTISMISFGDIIQNHGAHYIFAHRADFHALLLEAATRVGIPIHTKQQVVKYDFDTPRAITAEGVEWEAHLLVCADGIKSVARPLITGRPDRPRDTGDVAYRILIPGHELMKHEDLMPLITQPCSTSWCGPDAHIVGYPVRSGAQYNIVVCATSYNETSDEDWVVGGDTSELYDRFKNWEPRVQKLCKLTGEFMKWRLCDLPALNRWVHPSGKACLLGDACHPMLPYLAQGAAQAVEDAACLRQCLAPAESTASSTDLGSALKKYEAIRKPRASLIQQKTREHQYILHIEDSDQQKDRDSQMKIDSEENPVFWGWSDRRQWLFSHDAENIWQDGANLSRSSL